MYIAKMNTRVTFQTPIVTTVPQEGGGKNGFTQNGFTITSESWENYKTVWGSVKNNPKTEVTIVTIRYTPDITTDMRVLIKNKQYTIEFIDDENFKHQFINLKVKEVLI